MRLTELISDFIITFIVTIIVSALVTFLYNVFVNDQSAVDWQTSIRLAIIFSIIIPWMHLRERRKKDKFV